MERLIVFFVTSCVYTSIVLPCLTVIAIETNDYFWHIMARHKQLMTRTTSTNKTTTKTKYRDKLDCLGDVSTFRSIFVFLCILYSFVLLFVVFGFERNFLPNLSANPQPNPPSTFIKRKYYISSCKPFLPSWNLIYDYVVNVAPKRRTKIRRKKNNFRMIEEGRY